jgi:hypothetical protein
MSDSDNPVDSVTAMFKSGGTPTKDAIEAYIAAAVEKKLAATAKGKQSKKGPTGVTKSSMLSHSASVEEEPKSLSSPVLKVDSRTDVDAQAQGDPVEEAADESEEEEPESKTLGLKQSPSSFVSHALTYAVGAKKEGARSSPNESPPVDESKPTTPECSRPNSAVSKQNSRRDVDSQSQGDSVEEAADEQNESEQEEESESEREEPAFKKARQNPNALSYVQVKEAKPVKREPSSRERSMGQYVDYDEDYDEEVEIVG